MRVNVSKFASVYFSKSGLFNGLQPIQTKIFPSYFSPEMSPNRADFPNAIPSAQAAGA
jgi:hypothetical protein